MWCLCQKTNPTQGFVYVLMYSRSAAAAYCNVIVMPLFYWINQFDSVPTQDFMSSYQRGASSSSYPGCPKKDDPILLKNPIRILVSTLMCCSFPTTRTLEVERPVAASSTNPPWTSPSWRLMPPRPVASWRPGVIPTTTQICSILPLNHDDWGEPEETQLQLPFNLPWWFNNSSVGDLFIQRTAQDVHHDDVRRICRWSLRLKDPGIQKRASGREEGLRYHVMHYIIRGISESLFPKITENGRNHSVKQVS